MVTSTSSWDGGVFNQYRAAISGSMGYTIMGMSTAWPSPTLVDMAAGNTPVILDTIGKSWMVSAMFIGQILGPFPCGYLMEHLGRKRTCLLCSVFPLSSWFLIYFARDPIMLYVARFFAGVWIGILTTIMPIYVGEISGSRLRNSLTTINSLLLNFGVLFVYVIGPYVSYYTLAIACQALTLLYIVMYITVPESPYYYTKRGHSKEAIEALTWLRKGEPKETVENEFKRIERGLEEQKNHKGSFKDLFGDLGNRKAFFIAITYAIIKRSSGSGVLQAYSSITLPDLTFGVLDPDTCVIIIGVISFLSSLASTGLMVNIRRRTLLTISGVGCGVATALIAVYFFWNYNTSADIDFLSDTIFICLAVYYSLFNIGLGPMGTSIKGEIFAPSVKGISSSLTTIAVAITGFIVNKFYLLIADSIGMYFNFIIFSFSCLVAVVFTWTYVPDTQNKTLEEIRDILRYGVKKKDLREELSGTTVSGA